nr:sulfotransferase family 2 domain-containing protein [uncultured Amphritea sp.]
MPIDVSNKILFIHIPKTGGSSVERALNLHPHQVSDAQEFLSGTGKHLQHLTFSQILNLGRGEDINSCRKFCIIRNPVDRFRSEFRWRKKINHPLTTNMNEHDFAVFLYDMKKDGMLSKECHFRFQSDYYYVDDTPSSDIKVFKLEEGMDIVQDWINCNFPVNISIPYFNTTKNESENLDDDQVVEIVKDIYAEDALKLGYDL